MNSPTTKVKTRVITKTIVAIILIGGAVAAAFLTFRSWQPRLPDLMVNDIVYSRLADGSITYRITIQNQGTENAENPFSGSLYGRRTDGTYIALGAFTFSGLPAETTGTRTGTIPQNLAKGLTNFYAAVDEEVVWVPAEIRSGKSRVTIDDEPTWSSLGFISPQNISESTETNNIFTRSLR